MTLQLIPDVHRATHRIGIEIARIRGISASQGEAHILAYLDEKSEATIAELHQALAHKRSTLTSILDRLAARQLITRVVDANDRRSFRIKLTPAGARAAAKIHAHLEEMERAALEGVPPAEVKAFTTIILKLAGAGK